MARSRRRKTPKQRANRGTVLVVDDDRDMRDSLCEILADAGYDAVCVGNGDEALAYLYRHEPPAAILLDLFMPVMSGWELTRRLRGTRYAEVPVVLVTASEPHWGYPVQHVVRKPVDPDVLLSTVGLVTLAPTANA